jgi:large subunit ribosomal protein L5
MKLQEKYKKELVPKLKEELGIKNNLSVPKMLKVVINVGFGSKNKEAKFIENVEKSLRRISGQKPIATKAKKSISNFKLREGTIIGMKVTLRGGKMYQFVEKLINITLPRVRDFRGIRTSTVDSYGNLNIGFKENLAFPEINTDELESMHGLEVTIATNAKDKDNGYKLFEIMGFPFNKKLRKEKKVKKKQ